MLSKITILTPQLIAQLGVDQPSFPWLIALAREVLRSARGACQIEIVSFAALASRKILADGLGLRFLPQVQQPALPDDSLSWELPEAIVDSDLVHIHHLLTRSGEMALLAAKLQHKPVCVSLEARPTSTLGTDVEILRLANRVVDLAQLGLSSPSDQTANGWQGDFSRAGAGLLAIYQSLLTEPRAVAA